jgi:hypothetical protein
MRESVDQDYEDELPDEDEPLLSRTASRDEHVRRDARAKHYKHVSTTKTTSFPLFSHK